jgi:hypothetical protein
VSTAPNRNPRPGDLRVWWAPQIPCEPYVVPVTSVAEGAKLLSVLAAYDLFQLRIHAKPDYSNMGGLLVFEADCDGDGRPGWSEWTDADGYTVNESPLCFVPQEDFWLRQGSGPLPEDA